MPEQLAQRAVETPTTPVEESLPKSEGTLTVPEPIEKPLEMIEYIKELWQVGEASEHFEMPSLLKEINDFVLSEIERNSLESNKKSYEEIIQEYEKRLKLENVDIYTRTEKVAELMRIDNKLLQIVKDKEDLLTIDPVKMTSHQLKRYINATTHY